MRDMGYLTVVASKALVSHVGSHTMNQMALKKGYLLFRELLSEVVDREAGKSRRRRQKGRERILRVTTNTPTPR